MTKIASNNQQLLLHTSNRINEIFVEIGDALAEYLVLAENLKKISYKSGDVKDIEKLKKLINNQSEEWDLLLKEFNCNIQNELIELDRKLLNNNMFN